jgi:hypothetical protein
MVKEHETKPPRIRLAQVRLSPQELASWHAAAKRMDLRLGQLMRHATRRYIEEKLGASAPVTTR